jgi:hypothetical protein
MPSAIYSPNTKNKPPFGEYRSPSAEGEVQRNKVALLAVEIRKSGAFGQAHYTALLIF